jgi:hypothetical protein
MTPDIGRYVCGISIFTHAACIVGKSCIILPCLSSSMDRAPDFGSVGSGFDSWLGHFFLFTAGLTNFQNFRLQKRTKYYVSLGAYAAPCLMDEEPLELLRLLLARLERISADSFWAHRASRVRRSLLRVLEKIENGRPVQKPEMKRMTEFGFDI